MSGVGGKNRPNGESGKIKKGSYYLFSGVEADREGARRGVREESLNNDFQCRQNEVRN